MIRRAISRTAFLACLLLPPLLACGARIAADEPETIQETLKDVWNVGTIGEDARQKIETWTDREVAIEALSAAITSDSISDPSCRYWLLNALLDKSQRDANRRVRFEHPAQILALEHAMHDSSRQMRVLAAQKLTQVGESFRTRAQSALLNGLDDSELIVVNASAGSLWEIAEPGVQGAETALRVLRTRTDEYKIGRHSSSASENLAMAYVKMHGSLGVLPELQLGNDKLDSIEMALAAAANSSALLAASTEEQKIVAVKRLSRLVEDKDANLRHREFALIATYKISVSSPSNTALSDMLQSACELIRLEPESDANHDIKRIVANLAQMTLPESPAPETQLNIPQP